MRPADRFEREGREGGIKVYLPQYRRCGCIFGLLGVGLRGEGCSRTMLTWAELSGAWPAQSTKSRMSRAILGGGEECDV